MIEFVTQLSVTYGFIGGVVGATVVVLLVAISSAVRRG